MTAISLHDVPLALTFDDVLIKPNYSEILPSQTLTRSFIAPDLVLQTPLISAAMDTVTEAPMAIAMAQLGGLGVIHKNLSIEAQAQEVRKVKRFESGIIFDPITIAPSATLGEALALMSENRISGIPVMDPQSRKVVGILTHRDVRFVTNHQVQVQDLMTRDLVVIRQNQDEIDREEAQKLFHHHRIEKLLIVNEVGELKGLLTVRDMEKTQHNPLATKDLQGRLKVAAAVGVGADGMKRIEALIDAGVDLIVVDTAHGFSKGVMDQVRWVKKNFDISVVAGNIADGDAALGLIEAGADCLKVGIGPGSICTTRIVAGVGVPQLSAIMSVAAAIRQSGKTVGLIADGGIKNSGDLAKAMAVGADAVMIGSLLAGTEESPGEAFLYQGRPYKSYRGMGSLGAMAQGSADRYFQQDSSVQKLVPEGIEGQVPFKGPIGPIVHQMIGGLKASMGYTGASDLTAFRQRARLVQITSSGLRESHVHDVAITKEAPNYNISHR